MTTSGRMKVKDRADDIRPYRDPLSQASPDSSPRGGAKAEAEPLPM